MNNWRSNLFLIVELIELFGFQLVLNSIRRNMLGMYL